MMLGARTAALAMAGEGPTPPAYGGLCFTAEAENSSVQLTAVGSAPVVTLIKSFDGVSWSDYSVGDTIELQSVGDFVYFAAGEDGNDTFGKSNTVDYHKFVIKGSVSASGDISSLRRFDLVQTALSSFCYCRLFEGCSSLTSAPELPANKLAPFCYYGLFEGCSSLTSAPELPSNGISNYSYGRIFYGCSKLSFIKVHFATWNSRRTSKWIVGVSSSGMFYKPAVLSEEYGDYKIPTGWKVINID